MNEFANAQRSMIRNLGALLEAELPAIAEHHAEIARLEAECARIIAARRERDVRPDEEKTDS